MNLKKNTNNYSSKVTHSSLKKNRCSFENRQTEKLNMNVCNIFIYRCKKTKINLPNILHDFLSIFSDYSSAFKA